VTVWAGFSSGLVKDSCVIINFPFYDDPRIVSVTKGPASCYISGEGKQDVDIFMGLITRRRAPYCILHICLDHRNPSMAKWQHFLRFSIGRCVVSTSVIYNLYFHFLKAISLLELGCDDSFPNFFQLLSIIILFTIIM
jgi:hypothetical protein